MPAQVTACPCIYYSVPVVNRRARDNNAPMQSAMDPYWPEGEPVAFQCPCCLHCVKALQSTQPTCNHYEPCSGVGPLITMACHGQLLRAPISLSRGCKCAPTATMASARPPGNSSPILSMGSVRLRFATIVAPSLRFCHHGSCVRRRSMIPTSF